MRLNVPSLAALMLAAACAAPEPRSMTLLGGYRDPADPCRRVAENAYTNQFLDDAADLVACPADMENLGVFLTETGALQVDTLGGYILYSVPVR